MRSKFCIKRMFIFGLAALLLPALVACGSGQQSKDGGIKWEEDDLLAVAFLGYYDSFGAFENSPSYVPLTKAFPQIVEAQQVLAGIGRELYLVVPRDPMATLAVDEEGEYVTDDNRRVFYRSEAGRPVLLLTNWYGENSLVVCTDNEGRSTSYTPGIDEGGALKLPGDGSVRDISLPMPKPLEGYTFSDYGEGVDGNSFGISVRLQAGQPVLTSSAGPLAFYGFDEESIVLADGDKVFDGVNGLCKGVFLGTIGQDYNPVVCVVMEDGSVKTCSVFYAMRHGGPELGYALPGFKDVTGFESGGGGLVELEDGDSFYEYETIYALDARGGRTEIPYFLDSGVYYGKDDKYIYEITLSPEWLYHVQCIDREDYSPHEGYYGFFTETEWNEDFQAYDFTRMCRMWAGDEDFEYDYKSVSGKAMARVRGLSYELSVSGSDALPAAGVTIYREDQMEQSIYED